MNISKSLWVVLVGVSTSMANISGIVADTGSTPISGAFVQLEQGGWTATTGADGRFTLAPSAILPVDGKLLANSLSARITGNLITLTIGERSVVEVTTFDLNGKALSNVWQTMDAGVHSIALPRRSAGVYLYKVKSGDGELLLKGNSAGGGSSGSASSTQGFSSSKQAKAAVAINDVIAATKTGYLNYRCVHYNSDTSGIVIKLIASAGTLTDTDGNVYQTVRIGNQVWMAENLRVTKYNDGSAIQLDTSKATWNSATTPKYCFYNNTINSDNIKKYGALYNWYVVSPANLKKIAPTGWHVPSAAEWRTLEILLIAKGYNWDGTTTGSKIGKSLAEKTDWYTYSTTGTIGCDLTLNNSSGFSALPGGCRGNEGSFLKQSNNGCWWSATIFDASTAFCCYLYYDHDLIDRSDFYESCGYSVRLVKD